jgi:hypothetical protein
MDAQREKDQQRNDQLLASAVTFLLDGGDEKAATVLLSCTLTYQENRGLEEKDVFWEAARVDGWQPGPIDRTIMLTGPRVIYELLAPLNSPNYYDPEYRLRFSEASQEKFRIGDSLMGAFCAFVGSDFEMLVRANSVTVTEHWREELLALLRGDTITNQGLPGGSQRAILSWNGLRFRSQTEIRIAQELDRRKVLFLPNCLARLGLRERQNREADFLICAEGKWGILEVDGDLAHPPTRTAEDHERDRLFQTHGILLAQHFAASECWENADGVVTKFLALLRQTR